MNRDAPSDGESDALLDPRQRSLLEAWDRNVRSSSFDNSTRAVEVFVLKKLNDAVALEHTDRHISSVLQLAEAFLTSERFEEALAVTDPLVARLAAADCGDPLLMAVAFTSKGRALQGLGRVRDAIETFNLCAALYERNPLSDTAQIAANALYTIGSLQYHLSGGLDWLLLRQAAEAYERLEQLLGLSPDNQVAAIVAQGCYNRADVLAALGEVRQAAEAFSKAAELAREIPETSLPEQFLAFARLRHRRLCAVDVPEAAAELGLLQTEAQNAEIQIRYAKQRVRHYVAQGRVRRALWWRRTATDLNQELMNRGLRLAITRHLAQLQHDGARERLVNAQRSLSPLILFLRNFDFQHFARVIPYPPDWHKDINPIHKPLTETTWSASAIPTNPDFEDRLIRGLSVFAPVVSVANTSSYSLGTDRKADLSTLFLSDESWQDTVQRLIQVAELIVVRLAFMTPSIRDELDAIKKQGAKDRTVLVVPDRSALEEWRMWIDVIGSNLSLDIIPWPDASRDELSADFTVISDDEISPGQPIYCPALAAALSQLIAVQKMSVVDRLQHFSTRS